MPMMRLFRRTVTAEDASLLADVVAPVEIAALKAVNEYLRGRHIGGYGNHVHIAHTQER